MLRKKILIILTLLIVLFTLNVNAQTISEVISFGDSLTLTHAFPAALNEYQRAFLFSADNNVKAELCAKIAGCYLESNNHNSAKQYFDSAYYYSTTDNSKIAYSLAKIACIIHENDFGYALIKLNELEIDSCNPFALIKSLYEGVCYFEIKKYDEAYTKLSESIPASDTNTLLKLNKLFESKKMLSCPKQSISIILSVLIPGSGQFYTGNYKEGLNSILLLSALAFTALCTPILDFYVIFPAFYRYYTGGILHANQFAIQKQEKRRAEFFSELLGIFHASESLNIVFPTPPKPIKFNKYFKNSVSETDIVASGLFTVYKKFFSSQDIDACVYSPSCSVYTMDAIKKNGVIVGMLEGIDRIMRCHPLVTDKDYMYNSKTKKYDDPL